MIGKSDDETNFPQKLSLTRVFLGVFLGRLLSPLLKTGLPLIKNGIKQLAKVF